MNVIHQKRNSGKTTELIRRAAKCNGHIVCSYPEVIGIMKEAERMGLIIPKPISYGSFIRKEYYGNRINCILIDNVELLLQEMTSYPITDITINDYDNITRTFN